MCGVTTRSDIYRAGVWSAIGVGARFAISVAISIALARLLEPADFGLVALVSIFILIAQVFVSGGLGASLIREQAVSHDAESTVFWFNLAVASVMAVGIGCSAGIIADFFDEPLLRLLAPVMSLTLPLGALGSLHTVLLTKRLNFALLARIGVLSAVAGGGVAIILALLGFGVWGLAANGLVSAAVSLSLLWTSSAWRPAPRFSLSSLTKLWNFGAFTFLTHLVHVVAARAYSLVIGVRFGVAELGVFSHAVGMRDHVMQSFASSMGRVAFPTLSTLATDAERLKVSMRKGLQIASFVVFPSAAGLGAVAEPLIIGLYGEKWSEAVPILQILSMTLVLWPLHMINLQGLRALGEGRLVLKLEMIKKTLLIGLLVAAAPFGLLAVAWSQVLSGIVGVFINVAYSKRLMSYSLLEQITDVALYGVCTTMMYITVMFFRDFFQEPMLLELLLSTIVGASTYLAATSLARVNLTAEILSSLRRKTDLA